MEGVIPPASVPSSSMPFIISSNIDGVDQATRKLIRSHVMRGKKKKNRGRVRAALIPANYVQQAQVKLQAVIDMYVALQLSRNGTSLYFVDFPCDMEPSVLLKMTQVSQVAMQIIFPLLMGIGFHPNGKTWLYPVGRDVAALHINAFSIQSFIDRVLIGLPPDMVNPVATLHHQKGLMLLRKRIDGDDDEAKISDDTIGAVLKLASAAQFDGDAKISKLHMQGLQKMINLRGGLVTFADNPKLLVEIWRCDLGIALLADSNPVLYRDLAEPVPDYPGQIISDFGPTTRDLEDSSFIQDLDVDLAELWRATRKLCLLVNLGTQTQMLVEPATIYGTMTAVMYRLVRMGYPACSLNETIRLGLLAFTHHTFLQWKDIRLPRHGFCRQYRKYLVFHKPDALVPASVMLWLLMVGAVSIFCISEEPWLADCLQRQVERCAVKGWKDMQEALKTCMWIPLLDEESGRQTYERLVTSSSYVHRAA